MFNLDFIGRQIKEHLDKRGIEKNIWSIDNISEFTSRAEYAILLILKEKEIILFSVLQWVVIGLVYYLWVQILGWIPNEVWESDAKLNNLALNLAFLAWSFLCVALAAYPIGILTGCMGAAHFLRQQGYPSTIAACLKLTLPNSIKMWMFHTNDAWLTVDIILERLPKRGYFKDAPARAIKEAIYYAWKIGTIGVPPALLTGKGLYDAGKESIELVKNKPWDVIKLRGGYSAVCWIIGIITYIGCIFFFIRFHSLFESEHRIFTFYFWMGVPILFSVGFIKFFIRPVFVIASAKLYSDYLKENNKVIEFKELPSKGTAALVAFLVLCLIILAIFLFREEIGLMNILRVSSY